MYSVFHCPVGMHGLPRGFGDNDDDLEADCT